jgi:hypothetical protein
MTALSSWIALRLQGREASAKSPRLISQREILECCSLRPANLGTQTLRPITSTSSLLDRQQRRIRCAVTLEALETFDPQVDRRVGTAKCFEANRDRIEQIASAKFDIGNTEADGTVMIRAADARLL